MPLYLNPQKKWNGKRALRFTFALSVLLLAIAVMIAWMFIGHRRNNPPTPDESTNNPTQYTEPLTAVNNCLIILDFAGDTQFILVQSNAAAQTVTSMAVPSTITDENGNTLTDLLTKHGAKQVIETLSVALELSVEHYISWSPKGMQSFLDELHNGVMFTLPEAIQYTDENAVTIRLNAGEQKLTGEQTAAVLQYTAWSDSALLQNTAPQLIAAVINQYVTPDQSLDGFFAALADTAQTDLRIDNYNAFRPTLVHLAQGNNGALCRCLSLIGTEENGRFVPNVSAMRKQTDLYP